MEDIQHEDLLENLFDAVYFVNSSRTITFWNKSAERITGFSRSEVIGSRCSDNILRHIDEAGTELCIEGCPLGETLKDGKVRTINAYLHHKEGHRVPVSIRVTPVRDESGDVVGAVEIFSDNSTRNDMIRELEELRHEVYTDALTGAGNRKYGEMMLASRISGLKEESVNFGVIFIDLDHFKQINDNHGHNMGDRILTMTAKSISNLIRRMDVFFRWGGEEFILIVPNIDKKFFTALAERIRFFVEKSFIIHEEKKISVTLSMGATISTEEDTADSIIARADNLMYESKTSGRNRVTIG